MRPVKSLADTGTTNLSEGLLSIRFGLKRSPIIVRINNAR